MAKIAKPVVATRSAGAPVWSPVPAPDGEFKIAYLEPEDPDDETIEGDNNDLFLVNLDGTGVINLTNTREFHEGRPTWSPESRRLAARVQKFTSAEPGVQVGVFVYDLGLGGDGGVAVTGETNITAMGPLMTAYRVFRPDWAKTHDKIAVVVFETGQSFRDIWVIDLGNPGTPTNVTLSPDVSENMPTWSPDDLQIAFVRSNGKKAGGVSIFTMNANGSEVTEIGNAKRRVLQRSPDWRRNQ